MIGKWLTSYNYNLPLDDAAVDPELPTVRRHLADLARHQGLDGGYYEAQKLAEAFLDAAREANEGIEADDSPARTKLREMLAREIGYQRALFDEVSAMPLADGAAHLCWLTELMKQRADMYFPVEAARGGAGRHRHA